MKIILLVSRLFIGLALIFSGFIKMNDPLGLSYKLQEYFSPFVFNLESLNPLALPLAIGIIIFEVMIGMSLILGYKPKLTVYSMTGLIILFSFLTFYSAYFDKVKECGCFGDAIKLTPWESFGKDMIFLAFCIIFLIKLKLVTPICNQKKIITFIILSLLFCVTFIIYVLRYIPVFDFRPYKEGNNISKLMQIPEDAPKAVYEYKWRFKLDSGEEKTIVTEGSYPRVEGKFLGVETKLLKEGYKPPVKDFVMLKNEMDYTESFLEKDSLVIVISSDHLKLQGKIMENMKSTISEIKSKGFQVIGLFPGNLDLKWLDVYTCDQVTLKTIIRSNPGFVRLERGTIMEKKPWRKAHQMKILE